MTKEQILASNEPRTVKLIEFVNSWGDKIGEGGHQYLSEDYFNGTSVWAVWNMLYNAGVKFVFTKTLRMGNTGLDVKMLQTKLGIKVDGIFGNQTKMSVVLFQLEHHLVGDGVVGAKTNAVLNTL